MNLIANLARPQYSYTPEDVTEIFNAYQQAGNEARAYFSGPTRFNKMDVTFTFANQSVVSDEEAISHAKFRQLAEKRICRVLRDLRLVVNLSDKSSYAFTETEVEELFAGFTEKGRNVAARFSPLVEEFHFGPKA
jgi:hypothetical protein